MAGKMGCRGGGLAKKGWGAALKGGGMARKGVGVALKDGGKAKKMAVGGTTAPTVPPPTTTTAPTTPPTTPAAPTPDRNKQRGGFGGLLNRPQSSWSARSEAGVYDRAERELQRRRLAADRDSFVSRHDKEHMAYPSTTGGPATPTTTTTTTPTTPKYSKGGKVAKYASGGAVKMTAGAGSGLGRLEKAEAHKKSPRVKAVGLKKGGKVKMDAEELREFKGGKYMGGPKEEAAEKRKGKK